MKCPNCGNEISEGHLICEKCGYEIRVVPDFDPSVDEPVPAIISIDDDQQNKDDARVDSRDDDQQIKSGHKYRRLKKYAVYGYFGIAGAILLVSFLIYQIHIQSLDYQLNHAAGLI